MSFQKITVEDYQARLESKKSTPSGGSALALTLETAASLCLMVCNLTVNKKGYENVRKEIIKLTEEILVIKENAKNPSSIKVLSEKIMASKLQGERSYYIVKSRVSGTNGFGATVTSWYVTEVIIDVDGNMYNKGNIQTFDSEPTQYQIDFCKSYFGW